MTPEQIIAAFLKVWETQPNLFQTADLDGLSKTIASQQKAPSSTMETALKKWLQQHPPIRDAVRSASRGLNAENNDRPLPDDRTRENQYRQISEILKQFTPNLEPQSPPHDPQPER